MNYDEIQKLLGLFEKELAATNQLASLVVPLEELKSRAREYDGEDKVISSHELAEKIKNEKPIPTISSGYGKLDAILKGFVAGQLVTVSAPTKNGKTSFCIELTARMKDQNVLWFPFEEPAEELIRKFLDRGVEVPLFYTPEHITGNTMVWLEKKILESIAKYGTRVVFIDHLHFIIELSGSENMSLRIGDTMRKLKQLAKKWDVVIFLIAHLSKTKVELPPDINDLRDSSFVAQEADTVIMLWRETYRENSMVTITENVLVSVLANRRTGKTGNVKMLYKDGAFSEHEWESRAEKVSKNVKDFGGF